MDTPVDPGVPAAGPDPAAREVPCLVEEDEHLLVVDKPAGWNTHAAAPLAAEGLYDWLRHREPSWARLSILHRLDRDTSGLIVFGKTEIANRSLAAQFEERRIRKEYLLTSHLAIGSRAFTIENRLIRDGDRQRVSRHPDARPACTSFECLESGPDGSRWRAIPKTGRTHQIRVHAAGAGIPIVGDGLYGGAPGPRMCLHASRLVLEDPVTGCLREWNSPVDFGVPIQGARRRAILDGRQTTMGRWVHGSADGMPGVYVDRYGPCIVVSSSSSSGLPDLVRRMGFGATPVSGAFSATLQAEPGDVAIDTGVAGASGTPARAVYFRRLRRDVGRTKLEEASPDRVAGDDLGGGWEARENGVAYELRMGEGYNVGLFLDQRDNRRRVLRRWVGAGFPLAGATLLNGFAYTCGFSVCGALAGFQTTSLDLSKKYLEWGRHNFSRNGLSAESHDFVYGDCFDWMARWSRKGRQFDVVILDPPTFSRTKGGRVFRAEADLGALVELALPVLAPDGVLMVSTNAARLEAPMFIGMVEGAVRGSGRRMGASHYCSQGPDFPVHRDEPAHLKSLWMRIG